jgi:hypothetical protein
MVDVSLMGAAVKDLLWRTRWRLGRHLLVLAACYVLPRCATRDDLCRGLTDWSRAWTQRINEERRRALRNEVKTTTEGWQT